ncbi:MAG: hypothetical protein LM590_07190 [Thermofilum sp.]|nr:hypothetical protein [Thermofilum sp.]
MASITTLKAIKLTPSLVARFLALPLHKVKNPCIYCPGICLASCPTFVTTGNMTLSPLGYARFPNLAREKCLKCWLCVNECPIKFPLPDTLSMDPIMLEEVNYRPGRIVLVADQEIDADIATKLSNKIGTGLLVVKGIQRRYIRGGPIDEKSMRKIKRKLKRAELALAVSPETAHALNIDSLILRLPALGVKASYAGPVHIPCLLRKNKSQLLTAIKDLGITPTSINEECIKISVKKDTLYICPEARKMGGTLLYDLLLSPGGVH